MAEKHLHELLKQEQEPFVLKNYINERRCQIKRTVAQTQLQPKRPKPVSQNPTFSSNFCRNPCLLFSFDSDPKKSPLFDFRSPPRTPCQNPKTLFVNIPSRTAALLLESALRIQKQSSSSSSKPKITSSGFLGSVLKRIAPKKRTQKREICGKQNPVSLRDILKWESLHGTPEFAETAGNSLETESFSERKGNPDEDFTRSYQSSDWWKRLEEKSEGLESSSSSRSEGFEDMEVGFCSSPFRFSGMENRPDSGFRTPELGSPAESPGRRKTEVEEVGKQLFPTADDKALYVAEEENEQLSPLSILDAPFTEEDEEEDEDGHESDGCTTHELEHSLANVQRVKHRLLSKIRRFERLAALDPLELEKRITQEEEDDGDEDGDHDNERSNYVSAKNEREVKSLAALAQENTQGFVRKILIPLDGHCVHGQIPSNVKRLVLDLAKEERGEGTLDKEVLVKRVCKKIEWLKNVESNTIDMTVEMDFRRERDEWLRNPKEVQEIAIKVEFIVFGSLVDELLTDLD